MTRRNPIPKEPSPLALAIRANVARASGSDRFLPVDQILRPSRAQEGQLPVSGFKTFYLCIICGARTTSALSDCGCLSECREIERQMG